MIGAKPEEACRSWKRRQAKTGKKVKNLFMLIVIYLLITCQLYAMHNYNSDDVGKKISEAMVAKFLNTLLENEILFENEYYNLELYTQELPAYLNRKKDKVNTYNFIVRINKNGVKTGEDKCDVENLVCRMNPYLRSMEKGTFACWLAEKKIGINAYKNVTFFQKLTHEKKKLCDMSRKLLEEAEERREREEMQDRQQRSLETFKRLKKKYEEKQKRKKESEE